MSNQTTSYLSSSLNRLLAEVFQSYRQGLCRRPQSGSLMPRRDFDVLRFLGTLGWAPPADRLQVRNINIACGKGLAAARKGHLEESVSHYEQARELLSYYPAKGTRRAWLLGVSTYQSGVAYLEFRRGDPEKASECLDTSMEADLELEQSGLPVMQMHRIQQGHNLARMDMRLGQRERAVRLAGNLLAFMEHQIEELPFHRNWRSKSLWAIPRYLIRAMIRQIVGETVCSICISDAKSKEWSRLVESSQPHEYPEAAMLPQVQYALRAQSDRLVGNTEGYLCNLEKFFQAGIRECHVLWYSIILELLEFCQEIDTGGSRRLSHLIMLDSIKWKGIPAQLANSFAQIRQGTDQNQ